MKKIYTILLASAFIACQKTEDDKNTPFTHTNRIDETITKAILACQKVININPDNTDAHCMLGNLLVECGEYNKALEEYRIVLSQNPNRHDIFYNSGFALRSAGKFSQAVHMYNTFLNKHPDHRDALQGKAHALLALGKLQEAWPDFECRWAEQRPDSLAFTQYM
ncbi:tetratricopeptide repeat protein, partial [Methylicorpusculum sp.]|uniref:tetratricopeptide repeat protein n=1 Tax=Methylicorpusculum sp. TaxID=2713644 RepID=UPI002ABB61C2